MTIPLPDGAGQFLRRLSTALPALFLILSCPQAGAREITDMAGRGVTLPEHIGHIYASQPYTHVLAYMVAPDLLVGHLSIIDPRYLRPEAANLPMLGGNPGQRSPVNMETVMAAKPDFVLVKGNAQSDMTRTTEQYSKLNLPVVFVDLDKIDDYAAGIEFLGKLVGREERAEKMAAYARKALAEVDAAVATIPEEKRLRIYYVEAADGLATECDQSFHVDAIKRAGGKIVHECLLKTHMGMEKVSLEQIINYNPDVIVSQNPQFEEMALADPRWQGIKAVADHKILSIPRTPFNWIDRPPSVMRIIGIQWLAHHLYPQAYGADLRQNLRDFHQLFMGFDPSAEDLDKWAN
ncbi:MAG TPA: ABC transporter substrate-binding protein [Telmatospirillum sp.]|nr:ABC transporter substrate-binding protein [Telmatospirillum sp.]